MSVEKPISDWIDDARVVTLVVVGLVAAGLWLATWRAMSEMGMDVFGGMRMAPGMDMTPGMDMSGNMDMSSDMDMNAEMETNADQMSEMGSETGSGLASGMASGMAPEMSMGSGASAGSSMGDMNMRGMSMDPTDWSAGVVGETIAMWLLMMAAMMAPAMAPVAAVYAKIAAKEQTGLSLAFRVAVFFLGYFALWAVVSIALALAQLGLRGSEHFVMGGTRAEPIAAGVLLIAAGLYQFTGLKDACLRHCRHPLTFLLAHWREGTAGAFPMGLRHGLYCVGCCVVFMGLMFVFGAMALWWMAAIAVYFLAEKTLPNAETWGRYAGGALVVAGGVVLAAALQGQV